jgi:hypothetical protein
MAAVVRSADRTRTRAAAAWDISRCAASSAGPALVGLGAREL